MDMIAIPLIVAIVYWLVLGGCVGVLFNIEHPEATPHQLRLNILFAMLGAVFGGYALTAGGPHMQRAVGELDLISLLFSFSIVDFLVVGFSAFVSVGLLCITSKFQRRLQSLVVINIFAWIGGAKMLFNQIKLTVGQKAKDWQVDNKVVVIKVPTTNH